MSTIQRLLLILALLFGILALFVLANNFIYDGSAESVSLLDTNKNLSKEEAIALSKELGCTRVQDLGDIYIPCSSVKEYEYAVKIYNLKAEIDAEQRSDFILIVLIILLMATLLSLLRYLFIQGQRHESLKIDGKKYIMPGEWVSTIESLGQSVDNVSLQTSDTSENSIKVLEDFESLKDVFLELQNKLNDQDREIERLKKGYDNHLVKKFIIRFLRVHNYLVKQNQEFPEDLGLQNLLMLMEDALESSNVHLYNPEVGGDYRSIEGLAENPEIIETNDENQDFKIKSVVKPGYFLKYDQNKEFVQDAVVSIFSYVREEE